MSRSNEAGGSLELGRKILSEVASNAHRILGVSADASQSDIHAAAGAARRAQRLGAVRKSEWDRYLGSVGRSEADINDALGRLRDPARRLRERLFWFGQPIAMDMGTTSRPDDERAASPPSATRTTIGHDAALLGLLRVVLADPSMADGDQWAQVLDDWWGLVGSDDYWDALSETEAKGGFEPAATSHEIDAIRDQTMELVAGVVATAAAVALEQGDLAACQQAFNLLSETLEDNGLVADLERRVLGPLADRVESLSEEIAAECRAATRREVEQADHDPLDRISAIVHGDAEVTGKRDHKDSQVGANRKVCEAAVARFDTEVEPALQRLPLATMPDSDLSRRAREAAALCLHSIAFDITWADEFVRSEELQRRANEIAPSDSAARVRIEEALREIVKSARQERVWKGLKPIKDAPALHTTNGFGFMMWGSTDYDIETSSYLTTYFLVALFVPVLPIARYRVVDLGGDRYRFLGRAPLRGRDLLCIGIWPTAIALLCLYFYISDLPIGVRTRVMDFLLPGGISVGAAGVVLHWKLRGRVLAAIAGAIALCWLVPIISPGLLGGIVTGSGREPAGYAKGWSGPPFARRPRYSQTSMRRGGGFGRPAPGVGPPPSVNGHTSDARLQLKSQIDAGKSDLRTLESKIDGIGAEADQIKAELTGLKPELDDYKSQVELGIPVDEQAYQVTVDHYNSRVRRHNALVNQGKRLVKEHSDLLQHVNGLIDKYNAMP